MQVRQGFGEYKFLFLLIIIFKKKKKKRGLYACTVILGYKGV